jgi:hypothetical protein
VGVALVGVPDSVAVPFKLSTKVTPVGKVQGFTQIYEGEGNPVVATVKTNGSSYGTESFALLVNTGIDGALTVSVKACEAEPAMFTAPIVIGYVFEATELEPESVPVPSPLSTKLTPLGNPVADSFRGRVPVVVTIKLKAVAGCTV